VPRDVLATLYNAADVYVSVSAEGFGLTIAEAIACGVPAVGLEYSAVPEVIGPAGAVVPIDTLTDNEYDHFWARVDEAKMAETVSWMLDHPSRARDLGAQGPRHVRSNFSWQQAAEGFARLVDEVVSSA
jgi:glycosyltransferase involved in cell wall biosynthesis